MQVGNQQKVDVRRLLKLVEKVLREEVIHCVLSCIDCVAFHVSVLLDETRAKLVEQYLSLVELL